MKSMVIACFIFMAFFWVPMIGKMKLQRFSISTYSNPMGTDRSPGHLGVQESSLSGISVIRVGFRQYSNPTINSSSSLTLDNRFTMVDELDTMISDEILFYPNPFRLQTGARLQYLLNKPSNIHIFIYDMFGHKIFMRSFVKGMKGAQYGSNTLILDAAVFNYYNVSAGVYFLYIFDDANTMIGKTKFVIIP
jgi:hypothetical protein